MMVTQANGDKNAQFASKQSVPWLGWVELGWAHKKRGSSELGSFTLTVAVTWDSPLAAPKAHALKIFVRTRAARIQIVNMAVLFARLRNQLVSQKVE